MERAWTEGSTDALIEALLEAPRGFGQPCRFEAFAGLVKRLVKRRPKRRPARYDRAKCVSASPVMRTTRQSGITVAPRFS